MSEGFIGSQPLIADGFTGFAVETAPLFGHHPGTVEWLLDAVERHANAEKHALDQYEYVGSTSGDPVIALVMRLILEDETRHHGLLKRMEASLNDALNWTHSPEALPASGTPQPPVARELTELTSALIEEERTGARYMREVARHQRGIDRGMHSLLLEMMAMDSDKHARLLQFVHDRLAVRARTEEGPSD